MDSNTGSKLNGEILEQACDWFVTLREGPFEQAEREAFTEWLRNSPQHIRAYLDVAAIWADVPGVDPQRKVDASALVEAARAQDNVVSLASPTEQISRRESSAEPTGVHSTPRWPRRWVLPAAACLVAGIAGVTLWSLSKAPTYETAAGEQRSLVLADGSTVVLNSRSRVRVAFSERERSIDLLEGQALFEVAKDPSRPFVVASDDIRVRAVGTQFDVYRKTRGTTVTVLEGQVELVAPATPRYPDAAGTAEPPATNTPATLALGAGEQATVLPTGIAHTRRADVNAATAWMRRQIVFEHASLAEVAEEFNRYNSRQLVFAEGTLDGVLLSGVFSSTDPSSLTRFLREQPGVGVQENDREIRITQTTSQQHQ